MSVGPTIQESIDSCNVRFLPCVASIRISDPRSGTEHYCLEKQYELVEISACDSCLAAEFFDVPSDELETLGYDTRTGIAGVTFIIYDWTRITNFNSRLKSDCPCFHALVGGTHGKMKWFPERFRSGKEASQLFANFLKSPSMQKRYEQCPWLWQDRDKDIMVCAYGADGLFKPQHVPSRLNYARLKVWLQNCERNHGTHCNAQSQPIKGMRLIDCDHMTIVAAEPSWNWVALSYVWGGADTSEFPRTPQTITDAMIVTRKLGYRYLWVDQYCVDQTDDAHKETQIRHMDQIYKGAEVTIVAASGDSKHYGLPGVSSSRNPFEEVIKHSDRLIFCSYLEPIIAVAATPWFKRAWTFQEGYLSRRLLIFTDEQTSFHCGEASWMESLGGVEHVKDWRMETQNPSSPSKAPAAYWDDLTVNCSLFSNFLPKNTQPGTLLPLEDEISSLLTDFTFLVRIYAKRTLTYEGDALSAFSGVMGALRRQSKHLTVFDISGTPFIPHISDQECEIRTFLAAISWRHNIPVRSRTSRRANFPSWSWVGWEGGKQWLHGADEVLDIRHFYPTIRHVTFGFRDRPGLQPYREIKDTDLRHVTRLGIEALAIPASTISEDQQLSRLININLGVSHTLRGGFDDCYLSTLCSMTDFLGKLRDGSWSCLLLGAYSNHHNQWYTLVVEWRDEKTAIRAGSLLFHHEDSPSLRSCLQELEWKKVILE
ncbi:heterokaryon incompatibility protein-domain-containing protein [Paraphoma chrysanthemicola]|nr:heterokaryon incompatibility protein-domain-containing protein [Paraphoma chrysanthemicola]